MDRNEFARAVLYLAGHEITDPVLIEILDKVSRGEVSGDEARNQIRKHVQEQY